MDQYNDPRVAPWHGGARDRETIREQLRADAESWERSNCCLWWWREAATGDQGEGFATEAARVAVGWGFEIVGLERIVSFALTENLASRRLMEKAGLEYARDFHRRGLPHVLYEIRASY